ncbi:tetratricopeptide repeat protein [Paraburkholderia rhizosphaerae]|nr:tetratricopeptide repeat protein [Paraburkholderia rhizosphaerae]
MSYFGIGLHVIIAICLAVHAVHTRQNIYWLFILFIFPLLGSVVYFFAVLLPGLRQSRGGYAASRAISQFVDPDRALREARAEFDRAPTVQHRMRFGAALLAAGRAGEALEQYQAAANGPFADDPGLLIGLAQAQFAVGQHAAASATLTRLFNANPQARKQGEPALLYARTLAALGSADARAAFEAALRCAGDAAPRCLFADWLVKQGDQADRERARSLYADIVHDAKYWPRHARDHNREWLQKAQSALASMPAR